MIKTSYDVNNNGSMSMSELAKLVAHLLQVISQRCRYPNDVTDFRFFIFHLSNFQLPSDSPQAGLLARKLMERMDK